MFLRLFLIQKEASGRAPFSEKVFPSLWKAAAAVSVPGCLGPFAEFCVCVTLLGALRHTDRSLMLAENFPLI